MTTRPGRNCLEYVEECWGEVRSELFTGKDFGNPLLLSDPLSSVHGRQEGKLTNRVRLLTGDRNRYAEGLSRLLVFFAKFDQHIFLIGWYLG